MDGRTWGPDPVNTGGPSSDRRRDGGVGMGLGSVGVFTRAGRGNDEKVSGGDTNHDAGGTEGGG